MKNWEKINEKIENLMSTSQSEIDVSSHEIIKHYIDHSEFEMALEILLLYFINENQVPNKWDLVDLETLCKELDLDKSSVYDNDFWPKFKKWMK